MTEQAPEKSQFQEIISNQTSGIESGLGGVFAPEKIAEIVPDAPRENRAVGSDKSVSVTHQKMDSTTRTSSSPVKRVKVLNPRQQKQAVVDLIKKRTNQLFWEIAVIEKSRDFCPSKLERLISEIRHWQKIMNQVLDATISEIKQWYQKLVLSR